MGLLTLNLQCYFEDQSRSHSYTKHLEQCLSQSSCNTYWFPSPGSTYNLNGASLCLLSQESISGHTGGDGVE